MEPTSKSHIVKVCILGSSGVGKSSILKRFVSNEFDDSEQTTLGAAFMDKTITYSGHTFKFQIWDTAGQEKYAPLAHMYYRDTHVALLVYDITSRDSFSALKEWHKELSERGPKNVLEVCVGNKIDLITKEQVDSETAKTFTNSIGGILKLTSAKENKGIDEIFSKICEHMLESEGYGGKESSGGARLNSG
eukprot:CAMPEP_0176475994 /NCGR_PEP_ID=MMETSP0127-20121128/43905_1 /TAXON_ID=938130 /ORGANISM="Platyophrya macrostoma, Strain WH" /LENGTH=190 /DNA_ID=CAMNT_0017871631 /DNA_START=38 /DNA_END=606 /DNA_ORIENTATION=+